MKHGAVLVLTIPGPGHEVSLHLLLVWPVYILSHQPVPPIEEVCGAVQLQAAVVLPLCDVMDHGHDVEVLRHRLIIKKPLQLRLWISWKGF